MKNIQKMKKYSNTLIVIIFILSLIFSTRTTAIENNFQSPANISAGEIIHINNQTRQDYNLRPLIINEELGKLARQKMSDMQTNHYFDHYSPSQKSLRDFLKESNYNYQFAGENLAINFDNSQNVVKAWLDSSTHRFNMLHPNFSKVGICIDYINLDGINQLVTVMIFS